MKRLVVPLLVAAVGVGSVLSPRPAGASTIVALPEPQLAQKSDVIAFGTVIDTKTVVNKRGQVLTRAHFQVYIGVRGATQGDVLTLQVPGGKLPNGLIAYTAGSPWLRPGEMVFGFLERWGDTVRPLGLSYGLLEVHGDGHGGFRVTRNTTDLSLVKPGGGTAAKGVYELNDEPLNTLLARVRAELAAAPAPEGGSGAGTPAP